MLKKIAFFFFILITSQAQTLESLGVTINTEFNELSPIISPDGKTLFFSRVSHPSNGFGSKGSQDIWYSENFGNLDFSIARRMNNNVNSDQYNIPFSISPDGNTMLIAGAYDKGKYMTRGFSIVKKTKGGWSNPQMLKIPKLEEMSKGQYMSGFLANDGKTLLMAFTEKKDSKNDDLYVCFLLKNGQWTRPEYIESINTGEAETTPFLASDGTSLYFSSTRRGGFGGNDIWVTKRLDKTWRKWSKPVNLGDRINSKENEYYFSIAASGEFGYISTFNNSIGKGDLFRIRMRDAAPPDNVIAAAGGGGDKENIDTKTEADKINEKTNANESTTTPETVVLIKGKVVDIKTGKPIESKIIYQTLPDGEEAGIANTDPITGEYTIVLPVGKKYSFRAEAPNFLAIGDNIDLTNVKKYTEISDKELKLVKSEVGATVVMNNIFFETGKATFTNESYPELERIADLLLQNGGLSIEIGGHTDNVGSNAFNLKLSQERADAVKNFLISKKVPILRVTSKGFGETKPVDTNNTESGKANNRRVEFIVTRK
jgi:OmpA-OmpF porin, OOP family